MFQKEPECKGMIQTNCFYGCSCKWEKDYILNGRFFVLIRKKNAIMRLELIKHLY